MMRIDNLIMNRHCRRDMQWHYILTTISVANPDTLFISHRDKIEMIADEFRVYLDTKQTFHLMDLQRCVAEWLATKPSCIAIDHDLNVIYNLGEAWNYKDLDKFVENFYLIIAQRLDQMSKILNIRMY